MEQLLKYELNRLKRRNFWLIPGFVLVLGYFIYLPLLIKPLIRFLIHNFSYNLALVCGIVVVHHCSFVIHCLVLSFLAHCKIPMFEQYRVGTEWPYHLFNKAMKTMVVNFLIIVPAAEYLFVTLGLVLPRLDENWPDLSEIIKHVAVCVVCEDVWSYVGHRLMHTGVLYKRFHKKHHEYKASIGYSAEYAHPIEFIFVNIMAAGFGPMILGSNLHALSFMIWISYRIGDTVDQHAGYDFPWSPFSVLPFASNL